MELNTVSIILATVLILLLAVSPFNILMKKIKLSVQTLREPSPKLWEPSQIAKEWGKFALKEHTPGRRAYYKGMAALWSHEDEDIKATIRFFEEALRNALSERDRNVVNAKLAIAYLNNDKMDEAHQIIEKLGIDNRNNVLPRLFYQVINRQTDEVKKTLLDAGNCPVVEKLHHIVELPYGSSEMTTALETLGQSFPPELWIFGPTIGHWYWDSKRYGIYLNPNRFSILEEHGRALVQQLEGQPTLFHNNSVRFFKSSLQTLLEKVGSYNSLISITLITNMPDEVTKTEILPEVLRNQIAEFWSQISYIYNRLQGIAPLREQWHYLNGILGNEVERVVGSRRSNRFELLISKKPLPYALMCQTNLTQTNDQSLVCRLVDIESARRLKQQLQPLLQLIDESLTPQSLDQLIYKKLFEDETLSKHHLREFAASLPESLSANISSDAFMEDFLTETTT